jgi:hypothetical protein
MKIAVQIIILLLLSLKSFSQTMVWEKLIDYATKEEIYSVDQDSDTTFVFTCPNGTSTFLVRAKLNGDTLWRKNTNVLWKYNFERIVAYKKGELMHFGSRCMNNFCDSIHFLFQKFDSNGNLLASWDYGDSGVKNELENYALLSDGGFLASGTRPSTYYDYLALMKLDSSGNMLWYKKYRDISGTTDVIVNRKGNYLLSASSGNQIFWPVVYHPYFIEVTPDGDSINSKYLIVQADTVNEEGNPAKWDILQNEDGDYVFTITIDSVQQKGGTLLDRYAAVVMMDTLFNIKWKLYLNKGTGGNYYPTRVQELKDSSYVLMVFNGKLLSNQFYYYKISKTGQILDQKIFTSGICNKLYIPVIKLLSDGSLIVSGACNDVSPENAYLARIDNVGLPMVITAVDPPKEEANEWSVQIYPNPFNEKINFKIMDKPGRKYTLTLYNNLGQKISEYKISSREYSIERNTLSSGLYFYKLSDDKGEVRSGKLVAE